jgi:glycosyltransferase involved in cell wall biosynthesis
MKVAIVGTSYPYRGGLVAYNERLALEYQHQNNDVKIYTFTLQYPNFLFPGKTQLSSDTKPEKLDILRCINSVNPINWLLVGNKIRKAKPDLLIIKFWLPFMGPCFGTILRLVKKNKHTKIVCIVDNFVPHERRIGDKVFTKYFSKPVDGYIAMSKSVLDDIDLYQKEKPKILSPHPLFDNFGEKVSKKEACDFLGIDFKLNYILFFGLIRDYKGLDLLIEAFSDKRFRKENIKLLIAGEYYSNGEDYEKLIKNHGLSEDIVQINKFIPDSDVKYLFNASDIIVQPYKSATQSGVTQIAYHFEKPMIVTDVGGLSELCPDGKVGYLTKVDSGDIANSIFKFYNDTDVQEMIRNIRVEKQKYSWDIMVNSIENLIKKINEIH